jgi:recombinational DNA repair protein RecT
MGLMDLAMASGAVKWAQAAIVYQGDSFRLNGYDKPPEHTFNPFATDRGAIVGVYVVIKTSDGEYLTHTMAINDVYAIRDRSSAWKSGRSCPWKTDEGEMIKKTCVKQAYKYWPKTERLETAIHHLNTEAGEGLAELEVKESANVVSIKHEDLKIPALGGIGDDLPIDRKQIIDAVASAVVDHFNNDDIHGAWEEYSGLEDDERLFLRRKLPSNIKTALRKHSESIKTNEEKAA